MFDFEAAYFSIRELEGWTYPDQVLRQLPEYPKDAPLGREWYIRKQSMVRLLTYLRSLERPLQVLDIGCGNGWMSHHLSHLPDSEVIGVDLVQEELAQARRVFGDRKNLCFESWDVFSNLPQPFDAIVLGASIQYFPELSELISHLRGHLNSGGEIHVLDTPFYQSREIPAARARSRAYYKQMGFPPLADHYFHHDVSEMLALGGAYLYRPSGFRHWWKCKVLRRLDSPFPWFRLRK